MSFSRALAFFRRPSHPPGFPDTPATLVSSKYFFPGMHGRTVLIKAFMFTQPGRLWTGADNVDSRCERQVVMCTMHMKKKKLISYYLCLFQNKLIITHRRELFFKRVKIRQVTFYIILSIVKNLNVIYWPIQS